MTNVTLGAIFLQLIAINFNIGATRMKIPSIGSVFFTLAAVLMFVGYGIYRIIH